MKKSDNLIISINIFLQGPKKIKLTNMNIINFFSNKKSEASGKYYHFFII